MADSQKWQEATNEILSRLDIKAVYEELGLEVTGRKPSSKGWLEARSFGVEDNTPSAGINVATGSPLCGRYKDFRSGETMSLFDFAATKAGKFGGDWRQARNHYARQAGVKLPSGAEELTADRFDFFDLTVGVMMIYARGKPGTSARAVKECGGRGARWPKNLSAEKTNHLIAFPMFGSALLDAEPTGWHCVASNPRTKIRQFQGKGREDKLLDKMTVGERGLLNVDALARLHEADVVHIVEGITDLLAAQAVLSEWRGSAPDERRHVVLSAGACTYHPKPEWMQYFAGKDVRLWFDVGDKNNEGQIGAAVWVAALLPVAREVRNVQLPEPEGGGKNDLRSWITEGHNYQDMLEFSITFPPIDASDDASQMNQHEAIRNNLGIVVIGEHHGKSAVEVFCSFTHKTQTIHDIDRLTIVKLIQLCGSQVVEEYVHDGRDCPPGKYTLKAVQKAIADGASDKRFRRDEQFGAGIWEAEGQLLLVQEEEVGILNGTGRLERSQVPFFGGRFLDTGSQRWCDFAALNRYLEKAYEPGSTFCQDTILEIYNLCKKWYWKQRSAPLILAGLAGCTWLQTVWQWRPQIFITGESYTGKSMFLEDLMSKGIFGSLAMYVQKVTEAGITQHMKHHARILVIDEFEYDKHRQRIFELFRTSSRGGTKLRGTADQHGTHYRLQHLPWFAAINIGLKSQADRNRFIIFDLEKIPPSQSGRIDLPRQDELNDLGLRLLATALRYCRETRLLALKLRSTQLGGVPGRVVESFALPCAFLAAVQHQTDQEAQEFLKNMLADWDFGSQSSVDHIELLQAILTSEVRMEGGRLASVSELLGRMQDADTISTLARIGIRRIEKRQALEGQTYTGTHAAGVEVLWLCSDVLRRSLLQRTDFEHQTIEQYLLRLPGAVRSRQRLGGRERFWGVEVPQETIDEVFETIKDEQSEESTLGF